MSVSSNFGMQFTTRATWQRCDGIQTPNGWRSPVGPRKNRMASCAFVVSSPSACCIFWLLTHSWRNYMSGRVKNILTRSLTVHVVACVWLHSRKLIKTQEKQLTCEDFKLLNIFFATTKMATTKGLGCLRFWIEGGKTAQQEPRLSDPLTPPQKKMEKRAWCLESRDSTHSWSPTNLGGYHHLAVFPA